VTGTNGKTTTAALTAHLLRESGRTVGLGGNIGAAFGPAASGLALLEPAPEWFVVEVSSFQLADIQRFAPAIGVVTNLAPDHLDRYADLESYYRDKARLFETATTSSRWVLCHDSPAVCALPGDAPGDRFYFSTETAGITGGYVSEGRLTLRLEEEEESLLPADELPLLGVHNTANALAASVTAALAGVPSEDIASALKSFRPLPHRLEPIVERDGVLWVNDSKATNVSAARSALASLDRPLVVLLGGKDKGEDFRLLLTPLREAARSVVAYGAAGPRIHQELGGVVNVVLSEGTFEEAVAVAVAETRAGDGLLLSPACSSFDMFENYEARGECFAALARGAD
jgi:UDP-N-acetylmuramoylalanine--D-glutamate ligase